MSSQFKWIAMGVIVAIAAVWGISLFMAATHGVSVRRGHVGTAMASLRLMQAELGTNDLDTNYLAKFQIEPWTNSYDVRGRPFQGVLRTRTGFGSQGCLVLTDDGSYLFVYEDVSREPKLVDESYRPPAFPSYAY